MGMKGNTLVRAMACVALALAALTATPVQSRSLSDYRCTYNATVTSGHGNITGGSGSDVCAAIVGASFPRPVNGAEYIALSDQHCTAHPRNWMLS